MRLLPLSVLLAGVLLVPLGSASAQMASPVGLQLSTGQLTALATLRPEANLASQRSSAVVVDVYQHGGRHEGMALMLVGAAGIVTGLVVNEPIVTVASAGVGGVGLYLYLR